MPFKKQFQYKPKRDNFFIEVLNSVKALEDFNNNAEMRICVIMLSFTSTGKYEERKLAYNR